MFPLTRVPFGTGFLSHSQMEEVLVSAKKLAAASGFGLPRTKLLYRCVAWEVGCLKELHLRTGKKRRGTGQKRNGAQDQLERQQGQSVSSIGLSFFFLGGGGRWD